ncbi:hypothetical protein SAMN05421823_102199 [Catalinimonas alkaloidigena]|uniref:Uncharacterized protein n=1 Tax=Catalinimonas alkaloidigena TaxID=1075417 RepID=A0A1G9A6T4_9BACT|nr:hypothetical protein [Catalinimonas alkaloidigena]SDK23079.1 hypothetical protein SAMN05421823_102199 [Catalinimonas alkaloidigena]
MRKSIFATLLVLFFWGAVRAQQDLVPNPGFEEVTACPRAISQLELATPWRGIGPNQADADLFHFCGKKGLRVPRNFAGEAWPRTGEAYAGIFVGYPQRPEYREFIQVRLTAPLAAGRTYVAVMHVSRADYRSLAVAGLGMLFTHDTVRVGMGNWMDFRPQVSSPPDELLDEAEGWVKVMGQFVAEGGEQTLTIGLFTPNGPLKSQSVPAPRRAPRRVRKALPLAYYYIDDVSVYPEQRILLSE